MLKRSITLLLLSFLSLALSAQFTISGKVRDAATDEPLPGAHVVLTGTYKASVTDINGNFEVRRLDAGTYNLKVSYIGYTTQEKKVELDSDIEIQIKLEQSAVMGEEVIIIATRAATNSPTTFTNVSEMEIRETNLGQDLPYLIGHTPGVITTSDAGNGIGYTGIRVRGTDLFRINVTINGIPLNDAESQGVWWVDLPDFSSSIENIQIQRGVGTSTNGAAAFGASINIQSEKLNPEPYGEISTSYGSFNTSKVSVKAGTGIIKDKWAIDARYSRIHSDGYIDRAFSDLNSYFLSGGYYGEKTMLKMTVFSGTEKTYQSWDGVPSYILDTNRTYNGLGAYNDLDGNLKYYKDQTDNYIQTHYQLYLVQEISRNWSFNSALHYTMGEGYYEEYRMGQSYSDYALPDPVIGDDTITSTDLIRQRWLDNDYYGITFSFIHDSKRRLNATIGGAFSYYEGNHFGDVIWSRIATNYDFPHRWYENTGIKTDFNIYTKATWQISSNLSAYGDLQYRRVDYRINGPDNDFRDITQSRLWNFFNPKAGLHYKINSRNKTYLSFAVANREPNRSALTDANPARPAPVYETLYDVEAGYQFNSARLSLEANLYYMKYRNQLVLTGKINDVGDPVLENVPDSYRAGIELSAGARVTDWFNWNFNIAISENKIRDFTEYVDNWDEWPNQVENNLGTTDISFSPPVVMNNILNFEPVENLKLKLFSKYVGKQYIDNTSSQERKLDPYFVNDVLVSYSISTKFIKEITFTLKVNNVLDEEYETNAWVYRYYSEGEEGVYDGYFPQAGINYLAGMTIRL